MGSIVNASVAAAPCVGECTKVYFADGCFWERQFAYVMVEKNEGGPFQRKGGSVTSVVGYAGGKNGAKATGKDGLVCYHHSGGNQDNTYGHLGHAEAVEITLAGKSGSQSNKLQFKALANDFFSSFHKVSGGMQRPDPGDSGGEYRNMVGIPDGINNAVLYPLLEAANVHGMALKEGHGDETDVLNTVWVYDSNPTKFPFWRGEQYHQYHSNFFGASYGTKYLTQDRKDALEAGTIDPTGCPEGRNWLL